MVMGKFGGWWAYYLGLYVLIIPVINILLVPSLLGLIHVGKLEQLIWRRLLIVNGFVSIFASWWFWWVVSIGYINTSFSITWSVLLSVASVGYVLQTVFFIVWLVIFFRKKELSNRFYKVWGFCFVLFYFLPTLAFLTLIAVSLILSTQQ